jgi:Icc protein
VRFSSLLMRTPSQERQGTWQSPTPNRQESFRNSEKLLNETALGASMSSKIIKIVQLTDMHLFAVSSGTLLGLNTERSFREVIRLVRKRHPVTDLVLATGDLTHDGSVAAYRRFFALMECFETPVYCLPGNHDEATMLGNISNTGNCRVQDEARIDDWLFIFLDSTLPDSEGAHLDPSALARLQQQLEAGSDLHTLICLHHQPIRMGSEWLDTMALDNADEFFAIVDRHPQVRGIVWGHVHQSLHTSRNRVEMMSTPSTCIQFLPGSRNFAIDHTAPGYRWLYLYPDGRIETGVERTESIPGVIDADASGY